MGIELPGAVLAGARVESRSEAALRAVDAGEHATTEPAH